MATLRLKFLATKSKVPSRLNRVNISDFNHTGFLELRFTYEGENYKFKVPYIRPYSKRPVLSYTVNLNGGPHRNEAFDEFQERFSAGFTKEVKIECNYSIWNQ